MRGGNGRGGGDFQILSKFVWRAQRLCLRCGDDDGSYAMIVFKVRLFKERSCTSHAISHTPANAHNAHKSSVRKYIRCKCFVCVLWKMYYGGSGVSLCVSCMMRVSTLYVVCVSIVISGNV